MDVLRGLFGWALLGGLIVPLMIYIPFSVWLIRRSIRYARENGKSTKRWGWGVGLLMYSLVFWDWLPTVAVHQYYCAKDSGFWVYKTLDQLKAENPGVMEMLVANKGAPSRYERFDDGRGETSTYLLNDRFNWVVTQQDYSTLLPIIRVEQQVKDAKNGEVLARYVDFGTGNSVKNTVGPPGPMKFWLRNGNCSGGAINKSKLIHFSDDAENLSIQGEKK